MRVSDPAMRALLDAIVDEAKERSDGHFSIFRFTTNWRGYYGTVDSREQLQDGMAFKTFPELLISMLVCPEGHDLMR